VTGDTPVIFWESFETPHFTLVPELQVASHPPVLNPKPEPLLPSEVASVQQVLGLL